MIKIIEKKIKEIPVLIVQNEIEEHSQTVVFFHGFESAKEHNLTFAYLLAQAGYQVVLPDALYHGERNNRLTSEELALNFWEIILQNVADLSVIKDELNLKDIGVAGTSMGGITTAASLTQYDWISVAVVLMGSPDLESFALDLITETNKTLKEPIDQALIEETLEKIKPYNLSTQMEKVSNRPILFWHGEADKLVPLNYAESFVSTYNQIYPSKHVKLLKEKQRGHHLSRYSIVEGVNWFKKHF